MPSDEERIRHAIDVIETSLLSATDLKPIQRKNVAYWTIGTHALPSLEQYPILELLGPTSTGKNEIMVSIETFARKPKRLVLRNSSEAVLRDFFIESVNGTAILDEADASAKTDSNAFEGLLKTRFSRDTAVVTVNREAEDGGWHKRPQCTFGALVAHRQYPFHDPSLDTRTIIIDTHPNLDREYCRKRQGKKNSLEGLELSFEALDVGLPQRLMDAFSPLLNVAMLIGDIDYLDELIALGEDARTRMRDMQGAEPTLLVLAGILAASIDEFGVWHSRTKLSDLGKWLLEEHTLSLTPRQVGTIVKSLRIKTALSHGITVVVPTPASLLGACDRYSYTEDEAYAQLVSLIKGRVGRPS